jgi:hypothetical protein
MLFGQHLQATGSLLRHPAFPHQTLLACLNPLVCIAEGVSHSSCYSPFQDPNVLPRCSNTHVLSSRTSSLNPYQLDDLSNKPTYASTRKSIAFPPLRTRTVHTSPSLYVLGLFSLIRFRLNKQLYISAPLIRSSLSTS